MTTFNAGSVEATLTLDVDPFQRGLKWARDEGRKFAGETYSAKLGLDTRGTMGELAKIQAELTRFASATYSPRVTIDGAAASFAEVSALRAALASIDGERATATVNVNGVPAALLELRALQSQLNGLNGSRTTMSVGTYSPVSDVKGAAASGAAVSSSMAQVTSSTSFATSGMQALIAAGILLAPALVPGIAAVVAALGALVSIVTIAGGGLLALGAAVIGNVTRVVGAQKDLAAANTAVESAGKAAASAQAGAAAAARGVQAAEQGLANARQAAAQAVSNAEQQLTAAHKAAEAAQEALNQARKDAADRLADYRDQLKGAALDEEAAELAVRRAKLALTETLADPTSTKLDRDEARLSLQQALFQMGQVRDARDDLQVQAAKDRKAGVEGSDEVKAAKDRLGAAKLAEARAQQALDNAKRSGAQQVAAAQQAVADANRAAAAAADTSAGAQKALADAQADQAKALATVSTPAAQGFLAALDGLKDAWGGFLDATEGPALGVASDFLELAADLMPKLAPVANAVADAVGGIFDRLDGWVNGGGADGAADFLVKTAPDMISSLGDIAGNLAEWLGGITEAFAPFAQEMLDGLTDASDGWADWATSLKDNPEFQNFLDYVRKNGPLFMEVMGDIGGAFVNIGRAIAPAAAPTLKLLRLVFGTIADMDPQTLAIVLGIAGAVLALAGAPVAGTALALVGLTSFLSGSGDAAKQANAYLEPFVDTLDHMSQIGAELGGVLIDELTQAWERLQPALKDTSDTLTKDFLPKWNEFWDAATPIMKWLIRVAVPLMEVGFKTMLRQFRLFLGVAGDALEFLTGVFTGDWEKAWHGLKSLFVDVVLFMPREFAGMLGDLLQAVKDSPIGKAFGNMWDAVKLAAGAARDWLLNKLVRGDDSLVGRLSNGFETFVKGFKATWDKLQGYAADPVKFVVDYVYNKGIVKVVNAIPGVDNIEPVDTSGWGSHAAGGVLPGRSVDRDMHRFVSPTAGVLNLGGGEGILTTRAVDQIGGEAGVRYLNERAKAGTLSLSPLFEQSHAAGGVVTVDGEPMSRLAAAQLAVVEHASKIAMSVIQGSYQPYTDYSKGSHAGGGVMDTSPGNFEAQSWLRKGGFAAWGRNFPGAATAGSGAHVHSVSLFDPAAKGNAQAAAYLNGGDGLGGTDYGPRPAVDMGLVTLAATMAGSKSIDGSVAGAVKGTVSKFLDAIDAVKDMVHEAPAWAKKLTGAPWWSMMGDMSKNVVDGQWRGWVNDKIPGPGPLPSLFDQGGWMVPGGTGVNHTDTPEPVLTGDQWQALSRLAYRGATGGGLSKGDVDRIVAAIEENRGLLVSVSSEEELEAAYRALARELRK